MYVCVYVCMYVCLSPQPSAPGMSIAPVDPAEEIEVFSLLLVDDSCMEGILLF